MTDVDHDTTAAAIPVADSALGLTSVDVAPAHQPGPPFVPQHASAPLGLDTSMVLDSTSTAIDALIGQPAPALPTSDGLGGGRDVGPQEVAPEARFVDTIEIVADLGRDERERAADLVRATQALFATHMDPRLCQRPIKLTLRPCTNTTEAELLAETLTRSWFGVPARLASAEHLLWLWCHTEDPDHTMNAIALIKGGTVDLYRVQKLLRETDDIIGSGQRRLRLAIGDAVLSTICTFSRFMAERRTRLDPNRVPIWRRLQAEDAKDNDW